MGDKIYIGPLTKGLEQFYLPFNIDNDAFPILYNAYAWRGRVKRKRGTIPLGRLQKQEQIGAASWQLATFNLVGGAGNLIAQYSLGASASIVPKSMGLIVGGQTYTDPAGAGVLVGSGGGSGTINYATGAFTIAGGGAGAVTGKFSWFPGLPVLGLRDFLPTGSLYNLLLAFDQKYAYQFNSTTNAFYNVSFYKYTNNPVVWSGTDYQQFWSTNYVGSTSANEGGFWATNNKPGFNFKTLTNVVGVSVTRVTATTVDVNLNGNNLLTGDLVFFYEVTGTIATGTGATQNQNINGQTGRVTTPGANSFTATFDGTLGSTLSNFQAGATGAGGIGQYITSGVLGLGDGIRWYDGDPTAGTGLPTSTSVGWSNFSPPLSDGVPLPGQVVGDLPVKQYYLVGAQQIVPFKDRLIFFSPWVQAADGTAAIQLKDSAIWSWNGTPYYANAPTGQTSDFSGYFTNVTGKGGWLSSGIDQQLVSVSNNEDVLLVGFTNKQTRFVYTGNDFFPFLFYIINSELGSAATFSAITLDRGALTFGFNGFALTTQTGAQRIDLSIPTEVFQLQGPANAFAAQRISSARDFYHEWVYFTFPPNSSQWNFPTQTLQYNYRENSWGLLYENYTAHGQYRGQKSFTWATCPFTTWNTWNETWNSGTTIALFPNVIAGNPQGFVVIKGQGTGEAPTGSVSALSNNGGLFQLTSVNHCLAVGDYLYLQTFSNTSTLTNVIAQVQKIVDANNFTIDIPFVNTAYIGLGVFSRLSQPLIQTKQFAPYWGEGRQARIGVQKYLLDYTDQAQVTLNIYLSQDPDTAWNSGPIVPSSSPLNSSLIYSTILYTSPETNNLQTPTASNQFQIWHRINTSLQGESFQLGITLSDAQMRVLDYATAEIGLHIMQLDIARGPLLA